MRFTTFFFPQKALWQFIVEADFITNGRYCHRFPALPLVLV
jgi:hypothetical protein